MTRYLALVLSAVLLAVLLWLFFRPSPEPAQGNIHRLSAPAKAILKQMPGVESVSVVVPASNPTNRIIHIADAHFVPLDLFRKDVRRLAGKPLPEAEI